MKGEAGQRGVGLGVVQFVPHDQLHALGGAEKREDLDAERCEDGIGVACEPRCGSCEPCGGSQWG
jgi:hypothetical protein